LSLVQYALLTQIIPPEEQRERVLKALRLNSTTTEYTPKSKLLAASSKTDKPTIRMKRLISGSKLKGASTIQQGHRDSNESFQEHMARCEICRSVHAGQASRAEKMLRLNGTILNLKLLVTMS
jgi:hypothetical protein